MNPLHVNSWQLYEQCMREATCKVALDIGANDGGYTDTLRLNGFEVHAFEPVPKMYYKLASRFLDFDNIFCYPMGLSDKTERIDNARVMHAWTLGDPAKVGMSVSPDHKDDEPFTLRLDTMDNFSNLWSVDKIGIIKLDVDGYEFRVLRGGEKTIRRDKPPILCEFSEYIERLGESPKDFVNFIFDLGYKVVSLDGNFICTNWEQVEPCYPRPNGKVIGSFDVILLPR